MRYKCDNCGNEEWRGYFPQKFFHVRYALFQGVAIGVSSIVMKSVFERIGYDAHGIRGGLASLGVCLVIMLLIYGVAVLVEACIIAARGCTGCQSHKIFITK